MNPESGDLYVTDAAKRAARDRGEPLVEVSDVVAQLVLDGRRQRIRELSRKRSRQHKHKRKQRALSRRRNRSS